MEREPEFDQFAEGYAGGMEHPLKRLCGRSLDEYISVKLEWLRDSLRYRPLRLCDRSSESHFTLLDLGCGDGTLLRLLREMPFELYGCDISSFMVKRAMQLGTVAILEVADGRSLPYQSGTFDIVVACCLLHHTCMAGRPNIVQEAVRVMRPGGRLFVFEHNPWNLLTQIVVRQSTIDRNADLLSLPECRSLLTSAGLIDLTCAYVMFVPPRLKWLASIERYLAWIPLGGQYAISADKPVRM